MINLRTAIKDLEQERIDSELLKIKVKLAKDPLDYAVNNPNNKIGMLLEAKTNDIIWYYKTDDKKKDDVSIDPKEIGVCKYNEMVMSTMKDTSEILGYDAEWIFNNNTGIKKGRQYIEDT